MQYQLPAAVPGDALGITSLVIGIIAFCLSCFPFVAWILAVAAIVLGVIAIIKASGGPTGKAKAGIILACMSFLVGGIVLFVVAFVFKKAGDAMQEQAQKHPGEWPKSIEDAAKKFEDAAKKAQEDAQKAKDPNTPAQPPAVMLTHPDGWSVYVA